MNHELMGDFGLMTNALEVTTAICSDCGRRVLAITLAATDGTRISAGLGPEQAVDLSDVLAAIGVDLALAEARAERQKKAPPVDREQLIRQEWMR